MSRPRLKGTAAASFAVGVGIAGWNLLNFAFFVVAGHLLGPEDYGLVAALLAVVVAAFVPMSAFQAVLARPFAIDSPDAAALARRAITRATLAGAALLLVAVGVIGLVAAIGPDIPSVQLVLTLASIVPMAPMLLALGVLQGRERFWLISAVLCFWGGLRPVGLVALAPVIAGVNATLSANLIATAGAACAALWLARHDIWRELPGASPAVWRSFQRSLLAPLAGMAGLAILLNVDVIVAKLALDDREAGYFGAAAVLAKAGVVVAPQILGIVLLPRVADATSRGLETRRIAAAMALATAVIGGVGVAIAAAASEPILRIFGTDFAAGSWMLAPFIAVLIPFAVVFALVNYEVARSSDSFPRALGGVALLAVLLLAVAGRSVTSILLIDLAVGILGIGIHELIAQRRGDTLLGGLTDLLGSWRRRTVNTEP